MNDKTATRRAFFIRAGAMVSAPAAFAATVPAHSHANLEARLAILESTDALRRLSAQFIGRINAEADTESLIGMHVASIVAVDFDSHAIVEFSNDYRHATVSIPCTAAFDTPIEAPGSVLVDMARLQGSGMLRQTHVQVLELGCARTASAWTITRAQLVNSA